MTTSVSEPRDPSASPDADALREERSARHQAEADRAGLSAVLERITDAFFALDREWRFTYVNDQAERLLRRERGKLLGRSVWDEFPEAVGSTFDREYRRAMTNGTTVNFEEFYPPLDCWFDVRAYPSADGLSVFFRDISAQRSTAVALAASERRLRLAMDAASLGSFEWEMESGRVTWSSAIERMHGIPEGSFDGTFESYQRDMHPDDRERVLGELRATAEGGAAHHLSYRIVRPDGRIRWLESHGQFEKDADGRLLRLIGVCRDVTARHQAEEALRFQRYILELVTDNATSGLFMMDKDGHPTFMNPAASAMTGFTLDEIRAFPLHYAVHHHHPDGTLYPMAECPIDRALPENSDVRAHEDVFIRKDGSYFPVSCAASPIIEGGVPVGTVVEVRDMTEEKAARERLRLLTESIPVQVWTARPDGMLDYASARTGEYFGASVESLLGDGWARFVHPDDVARAGARWGESLTSGEPYETEFRLRDAAGAYRWHLARALALRDVRGAITRWFGSNTDIEDRREAERERDRALAEAQTTRNNLFRAFEAAPAAIWVTEGANLVTIVQNAMSRQLVGGRDLTGQSLRDAFPELEGQQVIELLGHTFRTGEPFLGSEIPVRWDPSGDGHLRDGYFNIAYQPLRDAMGEIYAVLSHSLEVTEQVLARQEIERKAEELARLATALERSNHELDQFAYVTSHDLKAPLRGIANLTQWIEEDLGERVTGDSREHMRLLKGRVNRMEALIDGILTYSRAARAQVAPERVDTGALAREVVELLAPPAHVRVEVAPDLPTILVERVPLQQVFINLIGNALKFTAAHRADPVIRVGWRDAGDCVELTVADNGPGIAPAFHERIWGIFQTLQARDKVEGTGIGLSVVKKIAESRGGRAWIESSEGAGATFHVLLPRIAPREPVTAD